MITLDSIDYLTTNEVAKILGVHPKTINHYVKIKRLIPFRPTKRKLLFTKEQITNFLHGD
jgi:excisionase family DNA binding protein